EGGAVISVADDGPGIPPDQRDHVFKRFYRLEQSRYTPGNGLGLSLVAAVARLHRAEVSLHDNAPGLMVQVRFPPALDLVPDDLSLRSPNGFQELADSNLEAGALVRQRTCRIEHL